MRLAFGALFIKQRLGFTDEETVEQIRENAYIQFFLGFAVCTRHNIRLSGKRLGRHLKDPEINSAQKQQIIADQRKRNEVEGCFGSGKRKYSLDLIMARLPKGAETMISMAFVVMCAEKIRRLLRLFLVIISAWFYAVKLPGCLWMALRDLWRDETADLLLPV